MGSYNYIAGWALSNHGGVCVIEMDSDSMLVQYYDDEPERIEIQYDNEEERQYIEVGQIKLYLDECMRY